MTGNVGQSESGIAILLYFSTGELNYYPGKSTTLKSGCLNI